MEIHLYTALASRTPISGETVIAMEKRFRMSRPGKIDAYLAAIVHDGL
jgi:hypothetical protein